ncbi:peptidoglycan-binding domain-containing protein [Streptomyces flaveus]|uniref:peptidoglycan-binding domain-containing protein n=1 Tax=Streptomyces flaveus TaxID=66370 RepID=UPI003327AE41
MRSSVLTRLFVSVTAVVGIAAGSLVSAGTSLAASAPASKLPTSSQAVAPLAVVNLGLNTEQATNVQCWLKYSGWGYKGALDGQLGTNSWKAFQRYLAYRWDYNGAIDGIVGSGTVSALQRLLRDHGWGYTGPIDGIAGSGTQAAFKRFADRHGDYGPC